MPERACGSTNAALARLSRVVTSLEREELVLRAPCEEDGRATNAVLTDAGETVFLASTGLHADAVRRMVLDRLDDDGVEQLAILSFAILSRLGPDRRLTITAGPADPTCAADPGAVGVIHPTGAAHLHRASLKG